MHLRSRTRMSIALVALMLAAPAAMAADVVIGGTPGNDVLTGTEVGESIYGRAGDDLINAGGGDDELDGGPGSDTLRGGDGVDVVSYAGKAGVEASINGAADDGIPGEKDNIGPDVEDLYGGDGDDKLTGSNGPNTIDGGPGADRVTGGPGADVLFGGDGDDVIDARDGEVDRLECGAGNDTAIVDEADVVAADCENISRQQQTPAPGLTIQVAKRQLILSSVRSKSAVRLVCVKCGKSAKTLINRPSVKLAKGEIVRFKLPSQIRSRTIELGVREPGSSPICIRYKVASNYRYTELRTQACTTAAKDL
ncbi:MAG: hypothetical protein JHD16_01145 [Solirubrobacteraceae bacterium]|nr:hypothetical protein [Solirubrobacteraceae bacterium]